MSTANAKQVGGEHYKREYQHWDFVCDAGLHYLLGCASKYVSRWRAKNGLEDLRKAEHYLEKADEKGVPAAATTSPFQDIRQRRVNALARFVENLSGNEAAAITAMFHGEYGEAQSYVWALIAEAEAATA